MKVTIVHTNNKKQLLVSTKTMEKLMERFAKDDSKLTITTSVKAFRILATTMKATRICRNGCTSIPLLNSPKTTTTT